MADFLVINPQAGIRIQIDFGALVSLVKGAAITSLASSDGFLEFGLSESLNLRIQPDEKGGVDVVAYSTLNADDLPPLTIRIVGEEELATAEIVQRRIARLRRAYAIAYLVNVERGDELGFVLSKNPSIDIESDFLKDDERLYIQSAGPGSLWLTIITKSKVPFQTAAILLALFYSEGRDALLRRVRANTALRELEVEEKRLKMEQNRAAGVLELLAKMDKIKDPTMRGTVENAFLRNIQAIGKEAQSLLPAPDDQTPKSAG